MLSITLSILPALPRLSSGKGKGAPRFLGRDVRESPDGRPRRTRPGSASRFPAAPVARGPLALRTSTIPRLASPDCRGGMAERTIVTVLKTVGPQAPWVRIPLPPQRRFVDAPRSDQSAAIGATPSVLTRRVLRLSLGHGEAHDFRRGLNVELPSHEIVILWAPGRVRWCGTGPTTHRRSPTLWRTA